eukprot:3612586-Alexandrium_andersonii.AAC.1
MKEPPIRRGAPKKDAAAMGNIFGRASKRQVRKAFSSGRPTRRPRSGCWRGGRRLRARRSIAR